MPPDLLRASGEPETALRLSSRSHATSVLSVIVGPEYPPACAHAVALFSPGPVPATASSPLAIDALPRNVKVDHRPVDSWPDASSNVHCPARAAFAADDVAAMTPHARARRSATAVPYVRALNAIESPFVHKTRATRGRSRCPKYRSLGPKPNLVPRTKQTSRAREAPTGTRRVHPAQPRERTLHGRGGFRTCDLSRVKRALSH